MLQFLKPLYFFLFLIIVVSSIGCGNPDAREYVPNQVLIRFKANTTPATIDSLCKELGIEKIREIPQIDVVLYKIISDMTVEEFIKKYKENPYIEYMEPNYTVNIDLNS